MDISVVRRGKRFGVCLAPSETGADFVSPFGFFAEDVIEADYRETIRPVADTVFFDHFPSAARPTPFQRVQPYVEFLVRRDPTNARKYQKIEAVAGTKVPDIFQININRVINEFYEIKPNSTTGRSSGALKLDAIDRLFSDIGVTNNRRGTTYSPNRKSKDLTQHANPIFNIMVSRLGIKNFSAKLHWSRPNAGLILYELCFDMEFEEEQEEEVVENCVRWFAQHLTKKVSQDKVPVLGEKVRVSEPFERFRPAAANLVASLIRTRPARSYVLAGGPLCQEIAIAHIRAKADAQTAILYGRIERCTNTVAFEASAEVKLAAVVIVGAIFLLVGIMVGGAVVGTLGATSTVATESAIVADAATTTAGAGAGTTAGTGAGAGLGAGAGSGQIGLGAVAGQGGLRAIQGGLASGTARAAASAGFRRLVGEAARSEVTKQAFKKVAGAVLVMGLSREALAEAAPGAPSTGPQSPKAPAATGGTPAFEVIRLIPDDRIDPSNPSHLPAVKGAFAIGTLTVDFPLDPDWI